ncbi:hypothetical protein DFJ73DRAFT_796338 [Zopfochytrium polystomum]|nr:hypothetical protein DFJ73DRAFT_796338 [Zopfochytrium polystomum]
MSKKLNFLVAALMVVLTATATTTQAKPADICCCAPNDNGLGCKYYSVRCCF